jgi:hypothetical protein
LNVAALFSEEVDEDCPSSGNSSLRIREFAQAQTADLILVIQSSFGSTAEVHDFAHFDRLGSKTIIFVDQDAGTGYSALGLLTELQSRYGNVHSYKYPDDIYSCHLLSTATERVQVMRRLKWLSRHAKGLR